MESNPMRMCELLVGLPAVKVLGIEKESPGLLRVHVERVAEREGCPQCGVVAHVKDRRRVELADLPSFGRPTRLVWHKRRLRCPEPTCPQGSWTEQDPRIAPRRLSMTDRAGRWITEQVGRCARSVAEVAKELGCDWHTVNDALLAYGSALLDDDRIRFGLVSALGLDEVLFLREGPYRRQHFSTSIVDVATGQLLDVVRGRGSKEPTAWLARRDCNWRFSVSYATLDLWSLSRGL